MNTIEPEPGMTAQELEWLRDQLQASIEHARGVLRRTELLILAAHLTDRSRKAADDPKESLSGGSEKLRTESSGN